MTKYYKKDYPRPQLVRNSFLNLNGEWDFRFDDAEQGHILGWQNGFSDRKILVPFSYECKMSGIGDANMHEVVWYSKNIDFSVIAKAEERIFLNVEGADYRTDLWVNGLFQGSHEGGYTRFSFDITQALKPKENIVVMRVCDSFSTRQPRGKQRWLPENFGCWYVQTTGIWKSVWAEARGKVYLDHLHIETHCDTKAVDIGYTLSGKEDKRVEIETIITFGDRLICSRREEVLRDSHSSRFFLTDDGLKWKVKYWSPGAPNLYDVFVRIYADGMLSDEVGSYFGFRRISTSNGRFMLNNEDCYLRMVLDQGYWQDSMLTPPDEDAIIRDINKILAYGYNGVRKHQKIEDERFYYWADVKGLLVWCEAPSFYELNQFAVQKMTIEWMDIVTQHYNHPSVIAWVPFNESWGITGVLEDRTAQAFTEAVYMLTKTLDDSRPVISNDGWEHTKSDVITLHDYAQDGKSLGRHWEYSDENLAGKRAFNGDRFMFADGYCYQGQPILLSEFGGIAYMTDENGWGYGKEEKSEKDFLERLESLIDAIYAEKHFCGFCYTQLTDVQQEQNGHMFMDRRDKISPEKVARIIRKNE